MTAVAAALTPCPVRVEDGVCGVPIGEDGRHWTRATVADPGRPHQIVIGQRDGLFTSCNCLVRTAQGGVNPVSAPILGYHTTLAEAWRLYREHLPRTDTS